MELTNILVKSSDKSLYGEKHKKRLLHHRKPQLNTLIDDFICHGTYIYMAYKPIIECPCWKWAQGGQK